MAKNSTSALADTNQVKSKTFTANLSQGAATYDLFTASGGNVDIIGMEFYNDVAGSGLVSVAMQTNDSTITTVLASVAVAALTGGKPLTSLASPFILPSAKKVQYTIVGTGTGGSIKTTVRYMSTVSGADIS